MSRNDFERENTRPGPATGTRVYTGTAAHKATATATSIGAPTATTTDAGSVTPLVIGMLLCLLLLGAGVTAAGSAFLAGQRLQHLCDGAAAAAAGTLTDSTVATGPAVDAVDNYLLVRAHQVAATIDVRGATVTLTCSTDSPITFGALFAHPTLHRTVTSTAQDSYRTG